MTNLEKREEHKGSKGVGGKGLGQVNPNQKHTGEDPTHSAVHRDT